LAGRRGQSEIKLMRTWGTGEVRVECAEKTGFPGFGSSGQGGTCVLRSRKRPPDEKITAGPAGILGLDRGTLAPGAVADVTLFDLERPWAYDLNRSLSKSRNSPFDGKVFRGGPVATIVDGAVVWRRE
jgi:hypothetical protein